MLHGSVLHFLLLPVAPLHATFWESLEGLGLRVQVALIFQGLGLDSICNLKRTVCRTPGIELCFPDLSGYSCLRTASSWICLNRSRGESDFQFSANLRVFVLGSRKVGVLFLRVDCYFLLPSLVKATEPPPAFLGFEPDTSTTAMRCSRLRTFQSSCSLRSVNHPKPTRRQGWLVPQTFLCPSNYKAHCLPVWRSLCSSSVRRPVRSSASDPKGTHPEGHLSEQSGGLVGWEFGWRGPHLRGPADPHLVPGDADLRPGKFSKRLGVGRFLGLAR